MRIGMLACIMTAMTWVGAVSALGAEDRCGDVLAHGIFNTSQYFNDTSYKRDVDAFVYKSEFRTHSEANDAGFSVGFPIYDVPIKIGGDFSSSQRETWRSEHKELESDHRSYHEVRAAALSHADTGIVEAWRACMTERIKANAQGLSAGVEPVGERYVYFWTRYRPAGEGDQAKIATLQMTGVKEINTKAPALRKGQVISQAVNGIGGTYEISDSKNVSFTLTTDKRGTVNVAFSPAGYSQALSRTVADTKLGSAGFIVGEVRTFAFGGEANDPVIKTLRGQGWLPCFGQELNVLQYPELYNTIHETWGSSAPHISFRVPDLAGVILRGWNHGAGRDPDVAGRASMYPNGEHGDKVGTYEADALQFHSHDFVDSTTLDKDARPCGAHCGALVAATKNPQPPINFPGHESVRVSEETRPKNVYVFYAIYIGRPVLPETP